MKRIANDVAVQSILYVIGGFQEIKIIDYKDTWELFSDEECTKGTVVYSGLVKDISHFKLWKIVESKCYGIIVKDNVLIFQIFMRIEQYK